MKTTHRCPKCEHTEVLHVPKPQDSAQDQPSLGSAGFFKGDALLEAYACLGCGLVEWYVKDVAGVRKSNPKGSSVKRSVS